MLQIAKTSLLIKRKLKKDHEKIQPYEANPFIENLGKYKIFSPKTLHKLLYLEKSTWSDSMVPLCKTVFGALLFADISGFTRLSAHLSAEELKLHINHYFSLLLGAVYQHYGDIIKFCGDAIIVMWPIPEDSNETVQQAAVELAVKCSLHLINVCGHYDHKFQNGPPVSLRLHCGVGCGKIHCMCLGDSDRWEFLISGDALTQVGSAEAAAGIGEVCVSAEAFSYIAHLYPTSSHLMSGNYLLDMHSMEETNEDEASPNVSGQVKIGTILSGNSTPVAIPSQPSPAMHSSKSRFSSRFSLFQSSTRYQTTSEDSVADNQARSDSEDKAPLRVSFSLNINNSRSHGTSSISVPSPIEGHRRNPSIPSTARRNSLIGLMNQVALAVAGASSSQGYAGPSVSDASTHRTPKAKGVSCRENPRFLDVIYFLSLPGFLSTSSTVDAQSQEIIELSANVTKFSQYIRLFVPEAARTAIEHRSLSYLAELRVVVTSFIQIIGIDDDFLQGQIERPQLVISIILSCLKRYGGSLRQYVVDDKGCVVILAFGLPGSSHEDNSIRAIETTARIRHLLNSHSIDCKIGITQGRVYCGLVGSSDRCEYALMGSSVNLAARFMSQASLNTIVVSHEIYSQSSQEYEYKTLPKMKAKGYIKPVAAYVPLHRLNNGSLGGRIGESIESRDGFRFVGRELELSILTTTFDSFRQSGGRCLTTITGAPGVGKSWLLSKFLHFTSPNNIHVYSIIADEYHSNSKYFCVRQLLDQIIAHEEILSPSQTTASNILNNFSLTSYKGPDIRPRGRQTGKEKRSLGQSYSVVLAGSDGTEEPTLQYELKFYNWLSKHAPQIKLKDLDLDDSVFYDSIGKFEPEELSPISASHNRDQISQHETQGDIFSNISFSGETPIADAVTCLDCILPIHSRKADSLNLSHASRMKICIAIISKILELCIMNKSSLLTIENLHWCDGPSLEILVNIIVDANTCFTVATLRTLSIEPNARQARKNSDSLLINSHRILEKLRESDSKSLYSGLHRFAAQYVQLSRTCAVHPLSLVEIKTMIEDVISERLCQTYPEILKSSTLSQILMRTGGSPYLVSAFILSLRETLLNGTFKGIDSLPSGEHNIIVNRFDKLTLTQQLILKVASVIGTEFTCDFLSSVLMNIGHDMASSVSGLELTLEKLLATTLITVSDDYFGTAYTSTPQSQPQLFYPILSTESNFLGEDELKQNPNKPPSKLYKFTTKTVQECIYNLMLKSQKEASHNAVAIVMENLCGVLPILHFDEITKHVYCSNNIPKKILYLEESLKRSIFQDDIRSMKETLQRLLLIATGLSADDILTHCCRSDSFEESNHSTQQQQYKKLTKAKKHRRLSLDTPVNSLWLSNSDIRREIPILPSVVVQPLSGNKLDPFQSLSTTKSFMVLDSPKVTSDEIAMATGNSAKSTKAANSTRSFHGKLLDEEEIYVWLLKFANVHFRLGNFKLANNFIILGLHCFRISPIKLDISDDVNHYLYRIRIWYSHILQVIPKNLSEQAVQEIINSYIILAQVNILRGFTAAADACMQRVQCIRSCNLFENDTSPQYLILDSQIHGLMAILNFLNHQAPSDSILSALTKNNLEPGNFAGTNFIYKAVVELSTCDIQNAFLSTNNALACYDESESVFFVFVIYILQGWLHIFSGNSLEAQRISEFAYQHASTNPISANLLKWVSEIKIISKIFSLNFNDAYVEWEKLKGYSKRDTHSATSSSLVSFILVHLKDYDAAFLHCKYAFLRLIQKPHTSPMATIFLFFTIYASLKIIDHCKMLTDPSYSTRRSSATSNQLFGWDIMTSKMSVERAKTALKILSPFVFEGMKAMKKASNTFPITLVLYNTLLILQVRTGLESAMFRHSLQKIDFEALKIQLQKYQSFKFGMAYYHHERSLTLLEYGEKYREQAQQAEDLSNRLFRESVSGNIGSVRFAKSHKNNISFINGNLTKEGEDYKEEDDDESVNTKFQSDQVGDICGHDADYSLKSASSSSKKELTEGVQSTPLTPTGESTYVYPICEGPLEDLLEENITNQSNNSPIADFT